MLPFMEQKNTDLFLYDYKNFSFPAHFHSGLELIYAMEGPITLLVEGGSFEIAAGELGVVFPGQIHSYETPAGNLNSGKILLLGQRLLGEYNAELSGRAVRYPVFALSKLHGDCALAIDTLLTLGGEDVRLQKAYAQLFLCRFLQAAELGAARPAEEGLVYSLVKYMEENFQEDISLGSAAGALYVSSFHLSRIFSKVLKMNFNDYLNSLRINAAVQLMDSTDLPITRIAYEVGFGSGRTFNRAFKKQMNTTPSAFRRRGSC